MLVPVSLTSWTTAAARWKWAEFLAPRTPVPRYTSMIQAAAMAEQRVRTHGSLSMLTTRRLPLEPVSQCAFHAPIRLDQTQILFALRHRDLPLPPVLPPLSRCAIQSLKQEFLRTLLYRRLSKSAITSAS